MRTRTVVPQRRRSTRRPIRAQLALIACSISLVCALPVSSASAHASASAGASVAANGSLSVLDANGRSVELLPKLTLPQLASILETTPGGLIAKVEAIVGARPL